MGALFIPLPLVGTSEHPQCNSCGQIFPKAWGGCDSHYAQRLDEAGTVFVDAFEYGSCPRCGGDTRLVWLNLQHLPPDEASAVLAAADTISWNL